MAAASISVMNSQSTVRFCCRRARFLLLLLALLCFCPINLAAFSSGATDDGVSEFRLPSAWPPSRRSAARARVRDMFHDAFSAYMESAFPHDELKPLSRNWTDSLAELGNAQDTAPPRPTGHHPGYVLPDANKPYRGFALTLLDSLSTLAVMDDRESFCAGVEYLSRRLSFDVDLRVHVFELSIRVLGGLLSAHLLITDPDRGPALTEGVEFVPLDAAKGKTAKKVKFQYRGQLLTLATDLGERMLKAFPQEIPPTAAEASGAASAANAAAQAGKQKTPWLSPLPYAFVHLQAGILPGESEDTCAAGAGTLVLEWGMLSALTGDDRFARAADGALRSLWSLRHPHTGLFPSTFTRRGNVLDPVTSVGSSVDSLYEYLLKGAILFDNSRMHDMAIQALEATERHLRVQAVYQSNGTADLYSEEACHPLARHLSPSRVPNSLSFCDAMLSRDWMLEVDFASAQHAHFQFNALQAFYPALLVLAGKVDAARSIFASFFHVWRRFGGCLPERYYFLADQIHATERAYPLRPELAESAYALYRATGDSIYRDAAWEMVEGLEKHARVKPPSSVASTAVEDDDDADDDDGVQKKVNQRHWGFAGLQSCELTESTESNHNLAGSNSNSGNGGSRNTNSKLKLVDVRSKQEKTNSASKRSFKTSNPANSADEESGSESQQQQKQPEEATSKPDPASTAAPASPTSPAPKPQIDRMESFFLAETLKYLYLTFAEEGRSLTEADKEVERIEAEQFINKKGPALRRAQQRAWDSEMEVHWMHRPHLPHAGASEWIFSTEGHLFPLNRKWGLQSGLNDEHLVYGSVGRAASPDNDGPDSIGASAEEMALWDAKRRFDIRSAQVSRALTIQELNLASDEDFPVLKTLKEVLAVGGALEPPGTPLASAYAAHTLFGDGSKLPTNPPHKWAHLFRFHDGYFHPELFSHAVHPSEYERDNIAYYHARLIGEDTARGGQIDAALPPKPEPHGTPFTASFPRSELFPPTSVRDALLARRPQKDGGLPAATCPMHGHLLGSGPLRPGGPPRAWWSYDASAIRWHLRKVEEAQRTLAHEEWKLARARSVQNRLVETQKMVAYVQGLMNRVAAQEGATQQQKQARSSSTKNVPAPSVAAATATGATSVSAPLGVLTNVEANGESVQVQVPPELLKLLSPEQLVQIQKQLQEQFKPRPTASQQQQQSASRFVPPIPAAEDGQTAVADDGKDYSLSPHAQLGNPRPDGTYPPPRVNTLGSFTVSSEPGSFVVVHEPTKASLAVRNLGTQVVEVVHEFPEEAEETEKKGKAGSPERPPRIHFFTIEDEESYIHALSVSGEGDSLECQGTTAASGAHYGALLPPETSSSSPFIAEPSVLSSPSFDPLTVLRRLGQARHGEPAVLRGYLVSAPASDPLVCSPLPPSEWPRLRGHIILVERGQCSFLDKALVLSQAGAVGMLVWNRSVPNFLFQMGVDDTDRDVSFPALMINQFAGAWFKQCMDKQGDKRLPIAMRRITVESGQKINVPPSPTLFSSSATSSSSATAAAAAAAARDLSVSLTGTADHFVFRSIGGWKASIDWNEKAMNYQLKLH